MGRGCWVLLGLLACAGPVWAQDAKALQALLALPRFDIPFTFEASAIGDLLVAERRETLVAKGTTRSAMDTADLVSMEPDLERRKAIAEEALPRAENDADRVLLWVGAERFAEAEPLVKGLGTEGLPALRAQVEFFGARVDAVLIGALGPLATDLRAQPSAIIAARPLLGRDTALVLRLLEESRDALKFAVAALEAGRSEHAKDTAWYRVWLSARRTGVYHNLLLGYLSAPQSNPAAAAKIELATLDREAFAYAKDTGDAGVLSGLAMSSLESGASAAQLEEQIKAMLGAVEGASVKQRLAAWLIEGAIRYAVLGDEPGARRALRLAWDASADVPGVRRSLAGPLALLTLAWGTYDEAAAFARDAKPTLGALLAAQIEVQALFDKGDLAGASRALDALGDPAAETWKGVAASVVAAKGARDKVVWKGLSDAFTVVFAKVYTGEDVQIKVDALYHSAVLAALGGENERARSANVLLLEIEPTSERVVALQKALAGKNP